MKTNKQNFLFYKNLIKHQGLFFKCLNSRDLNFKQKRGPFLHLNDVVIRNSDAEQKELRFTASQRKAGMWLQVCYVVARGMSAFCSIEFDSKMCAVLRALHCCCCRRFLFCDPWKARKIKWLPPFSIFHQLTYLSYLPRTQSA